MRLMLGVLPMLGFAALAQTGLFDPAPDRALAPARNLKERKWLFRTLTSALLTLQIGKRGLDTWWGMLVLIISQVLLIEVTDFSPNSLNSFSRMLLPSQVGLIIMQASQEDSSFVRTIVLAFAIRTLAAVLLVTPTLLEHLCQLCVLVPSVIIAQWDRVDEAFLTRLALLTSLSVLVPIALDDVTQTLVQANERFFAQVVPSVERALLVSADKEGGRKRLWIVFSALLALACALGITLLLPMEQLNYYEFLWNAVAGLLLLISVFTWDMSYASTYNSSSSSKLQQQHTPQLAPSSTSPPTPGGGSGSATSSAASPQGKETDQVGFLQRAQQEDLLTFQACLSFIHMLIVLFMTSIDLPHLAFVNLVIIASLLFQNHTPQSLHELVSGVVVAQSLSLLVLRYQLQDALRAARALDVNAQLVGVDAVAEQVGLVFCSIRLVAGAILTENFSRHAAETLLLASVSIYCSTGYSTKYLCLVMMGMSIFASRIKASTVSLAISWLNSEYELRRFMDHELRVSFAGIMLALEHCLQSEREEARLPEDTIQMLNDALAECKRGKELCFQATMQRLAYDNAYELQIEGKTLDEGIQQNYHNVATIISTEDASIRHYVVHTDWNLVNHILDNAVANGSKYGTNVVMRSTIEQQDGGDGQAVLKLRVTNKPLRNERFEALLKMTDNSDIFEYTPADNEERKLGSNLWSLGGPSGGRNSSTHIGLPVAKVFASRLGGTVKLVAEPDLVTFVLDVPVFITPPEPASALDSATAAQSSDLGLMAMLSPRMQYHAHSAAAAAVEEVQQQPPAQPDHGGMRHASRSSDSSEAGAEHGEIPAGLIFASLDDSAMIRSTIECMLYREFKASPLSIVRGATAEEAASFAKQVVELGADICIVDENLDYDEVAFVGTNVVKELRTLGYEGVVVLYSANEKLGTKLNLELVDGFASKSASRLETKQLLAGIYWNKREKKRFVSTLSERVFVFPEVEDSGATTTLLLPPSQAASSRGSFSKDKHRFVIGSVDKPHFADLPDEVIRIGILPGEGQVFAYSPMVRFAHVRLRNIEIPALMSTRVDFAHMLHFAHFDLVCHASQLDKCDYPLLAGLGLDGARFRKPGVALNQDMMRSVIIELGPPDVQLSMIDAMNQGIREGLDRINKRPTTDGVRKVAHMIKGSSVQIGARALHQCASKLEKSCMEDFTGTAEENWRLFCEFILLLLDFTQVSSSLVVIEEEE